VGDTHQRNAQHLQHLAESRSDQLSKDKDQLSSSLTAAHYELEIERERVASSSRHHVTELKGLQAVAGRGKKKRFLKFSTASFRWNVLDLKIQCEKEDGVAFVSRIDQL